MPLVSNSVIIKSRVSGLRKQLIHQKSEKTGKLPKGLVKIGNNVSPAVGLSAKHCFKGNRLRLDFLTKSGKIS